MDMTKLRELVVNGYATFDIELGGRKVKFRTLTTKETIVATILKELMVTRRLMTNELFMSLDSLIKLALGVISIDGQAIEPEIPQEEFNKLFVSSLGLSPSSQAEFEKEIIAFYEKYLLPRLEVLLAFPVTLLDEIILEINNKLDELKNLLRSGEAEKN
ncbi:MAG TPA: hypothetical protein PKV93_01010 [Fervidobacterium sp.]|nr:hypothetical protein [Fervidobacterium sp.]